MASDREMYYEMRMQQGLFQAAQPPDGSGWRENSLPKQRDAAFTSTAA
jgi:hypothetical protein